MELKEKEQLKELIKELPEQLQQVMRLSYGLDDGKERSLLEVSEIMGISRERVHQLREKAFELIREGK